MTIDPQQQPDVLSHPQPPHRRRQTGKIFLAICLLALVGAGIIAWWLLSPLFLHHTSNDGNPFAHAPSVRSAPVPGRLPDTAPTLVPTGPMILATGKFIDKANSGVGLANDHGSGNVTIGRTSDGKHLLHLDHLNIT